MSKKTKTASGPDDDEKFTPTLLRAVSRACEVGLTDPEIADLVGVHADTLSVWKSRYPKLLAAMVVGRGPADDRVERALYQRAVGYERHAVKIFLRPTDPEPVYADYMEHVPPDVTACWHWLKNRRPEQWKDRRELTLVDPNGNSVQIDDEVVDPEVAAQIYQQMVTRP